MAQVISFMAFKGGVGKSTSATNVAGVLAKHGKKVLLVDVDFQSNTTLGFGYDPDSLEGKSLYEVLHNEIDVNDVIIKTEHGIDIIPSSLDLSAMDMDLIKDMEKKEIWEDHFFVFKQFIDSIKSNYDFVIVDSGPSLSMLNANVILATDLFMIPLQMGRFSYRGTTKFIEEIKQIRGEDTNFKCHVFGTFFERRTNISADVIEIAKKELPEMGVSLAPILIPKTIKYENAQAYKNLPLTLVETSDATEAYDDLVRSVIL